MTSIIACSFSSGIDDMPRQKQGSITEVLRVLQAQERKRFSAFEVTDNMVIARIMTKLVHEGYIGTDHSCGYPWTAYKLTAKGLEAIKDTP